MKFLLIAAAAGAGLLGAAMPSEVAAELRRMELDPAECYRVRDLRLERGEDLKFYFNDGYLIFGKPVAGRPVAAVFSADTEGGDAELLLMPPSRGERVSLAAFTGSPTLNEHFRTALLLFTDDTAAAVLDELRRRGGGAAEKSRERGLLLASEWNPIVGNISGSFSIRLVQHLAAGYPPERGIFYAAVQGRKLGNFDVSCDNVASEQIHVGQIKYLETRAFYDTWTNFPSRPFRTGARRLAGPELELSNYRIDARLDAELQLAVTTRATATPKRGPLSVLSFEITDGMTVTGAKVDGQAVEVFTRDSLRANLLRRNESTLFLVTPGRPLEAGRGYEIEFEHKGNVVRHAGRDVYYVASRSNWYPQASSGIPLPFASFDLKFAYPAHLQIVLPGEVKEDRTEGALRTTRSVTPGPIRTAGFNLGRYESVKATRGPLEVEVFANKQVEFALRGAGPDVVVAPPPMPMPFPRRPSPGSGATGGGQILSVPMMPNPTARLQEMAAEIAAAFEFLASSLGPPAVPSLKISPIPGAFGQGFPGLVYMSTLSYLEPRERPAAARDTRIQLFLDEILHAHETAHQWWGNVVTTGGSQDDWLLEALANYTALMVLEKRKGTRAMMQVLGAYRERLVEEREGKTVESAGPIRLGMRLQSSQAPGGWRDIVYGKGSWIMHMVRRRLGDAAFLKMLGGLCREYRFQPLTVSAFQAAAAAQLPPGSADAKLEAFFDHWVDNTGIPSFTLTSKLQGKAPNLKLAVTVTQTGVDEQATFRVPVEVQIARGKTQTLWVTTGDAPGTATLALRAAPVKVTLDPDDALLAVKK